MVVSGWLQRTFVGRSVVAELMRNASDDLPGHRPLPLRSLTGTEAHLFFLPCLGQKPQAVGHGAEWPGRGSRLAVIHTATASLQRERRVIYSRERRVVCSRVLLPRTPGLLVAGAPSASPRPDGPGLTARPDRAAACPLPLHPSPPGQKPALSATLIPTKLPRKACVPPTPPRRARSASPPDRLQRLQLPACNGAAPGAGRGRAAARHAGSWSRALAVAQHRLGARGGVGLSEEQGSHCRRRREERFLHGPQDSALGDGERPPLLGSLGGGRAGGRSGVELRGGFWQPGPAAGRGRARPFLWRRRAEGKEAALGGPRWRRARRGPPARG